MLPVGRIRHRRNRPVLTLCRVLVGKEGEPVSVTATDGDPHDCEGPQLRDIIVWMDHRAIAEAEEINATGHDVLLSVGGTISPEMQVPRLLWLKRHLPEAYQATERYEWRQLTKGSKR